MESDSVTSSADEKDLHVLLPKSEPDTRLDSSPTPPDLPIESPDIFPDSPKLLIQSPDLLQQSLSSSSRAPDISLETTNTLYTTHDLSSGTTNSSDTTDIFSNSADTSSNSAETSADTSSNSADTSADTSSNSADTSSPTDTSSPPDLPPPDTLQSSPGVEWAPQVLNSASGQPSFSDVSSQEPSHISRYETADERTPVPLPRRRIGKDYNEEAGVQDRVNATFESTFSPSTLSSSPSLISSRTDSPSLSTMDTPSSTALSSSTPFKDTPSSLPLSTSTPVATGPNASKNPSVVISPCSDLGDIGSTDTNSDLVSSDITSSNLGPSDPSSDPSDTLPSIHVTTPGGGLTSPESDFSFPPSLSTTTEDRDSEEEYFEEYHLPNTHENAFVRHLSFRRKVRTTPINAPDAERIEGLVRTGEFVRHGSIRKRIVPEEELEKEI